MIAGDKVILREKKLEDANEDYVWETDPELAHLDAAPIIVSTLWQYMQDYAEELRYTAFTSHRFSIDTLDGLHIGNCSYYNISETRGEAEVGIMIGNRDYWDKGYGTDTITTLLNHIFEETSLKYIHLKTLQSNTRAQKCFQKCGFTPCGRLNRDGYSFTLMEIHRDQWREQSKEA